MRRVRRRPTSRLRGLVHVVRVIAVRPLLWPAAAGAARRLVPRRWWLRPPFLPVPDRDYLRFRYVTALGGDGTSHAEPDDLIQWLEWCRRWPSMATT